MALEALQEAHSCPAPERRCQVSCQTRCSAFETCASRVCAAGACFWTRSDLNCDDMAQAAAACGQHPGGRHGAQRSQKAAQTFQSAGLSSRRRGRSRASSRCQVRSCRFQRVVTPRTHAGFCGYTHVNYVRDVILFQSQFRLRRSPR